MIWLLAYWKWILAALIIAALCFGVWDYGHRRYDAGVATTVAADATLAAATAVKNAALEAQWKNEALEKQDAIRKENDFLAAQQLSVPVRVVRLCVSAASSSRAVPGQTGASTAGPASTGTLPKGPGPDLGQRLYDLMDEADKIVAQCR